MNRRAFLSATAGLGAVSCAGCLWESQPATPEDSGGESGTPESNTDNTPTAESPPSETATATPTETATARPASPQIRSSEYFLADSVTAPPDGQIPWVRIEVENPGTVPQTLVYTDLRFYDTEDTLLETRQGFTPYLPTETTWRDYIRYYTETPGRLDRVEVSVGETRPRPAISPLQGVTVRSSSMRADPEAGVELAAEIELGNADPSSVTVIGLLYDDAGRFRGAIRMPDTKPRETVAVSRGTIAVRTPPNLEDESIAEHEFLVFEGLI